MQQQLGQIARPGSVPGRHGTALAGMPLLICGPALLAIALLLARGKYLGHPRLFCFIIISAGLGFILARIVLFRKQLREGGEHRDDGPLHLRLVLFELMAVVLPVSSWIASVFGIIVSFR